MIVNKRCAVKILTTLSSGIWLGLSVFFIQFSAFAQARQPAKGFQFGNSYAAGSFDAVNVSNGNVVINLPLASLPAGRGTSPGAGVTLQYNSKLWDAKQTNFSNHLQQGGGDPNNTSGNYFYSSNKLQLSDRAGWKVLYYYNLIETNRIDVASPDPCNGGSIDEYNARWKLEMEFPDGSVRQFIPVYGAGTKTKDGYYNISRNGVSYGFATQTNPANGLCYVTGGTTQITTGGMTYMTTDGSRLRLFVPYNNNPYNSTNWKLYTPDGTVIENAPPNDTTVMQRVTDRNNNFIEIKPTQIVDQLGRSITIDENGVTVKGVGGESVTTQLVGGSRWIHRKYTAIENNPDEIVPQGTERSDEVNVAIQTIQQVILPTQAGGQSYSFEYYADTTQQFGTNYTNGWGELKSVTLPSGAKATYTYDELEGTDYRALDIVESHVAQREMAYTDSYDGASTPRTETTSYSSFNGISSVRNPDGTASAEYTFHSIYGSYWDSGLAYRSSHSDGSKIERIWKQNLPIYSGSSYPYAYQTPGNANAFVKTEFTTISDASNQPSLTAIKDFNYDKNGNVTKIVEYDWVSYGSVPRQNDSPTGIPANAVVKRITVNEYYNQTPDANSTSSSPYTYENANSPKLKNVLKSTEVQNAAGTPVARSEFYYDDADNKGNLTETRTWDSTKQVSLQSADASGYKLISNNYVSTSAQYNPNGSPTLIADAKGVQTTITYGDVSGPNGNVTGLYPTKTETASNYTTLKRTSTAVYDFYTGLVTSTTDVDNSVTNTTTYDALGRPKKIAAAVGTPLEIWTQNIYDDAARTVTTKADLFTKGDGKKVGIQHFDQLGRVFLTRTLEDSAIQSATNINDGIKVQTRYKTGNPYSYQLTSNPYRATISTGATNEPSMGWTLSTAKNTGKHLEVETFSGAALPSAFDGNNTNSTGKVQTDTDADRTLVTDQAGKQRISKTNALGQLTDVWEVKASDSQTTAVSFPNQTLAAGYQTNYEYDTLNNLTKVIQGTAQANRTFSYSSLSRLKSAFNPESGTIAYLYDDNGNLTKKTDARLVETNYVYDALNRVTGRTYTAPANLANYQASLPVTYIYDNLANAKGRLTKVVTGSTSSPFSVTDYQAFDKLGRVMQSQQTTDGTVYPAQTYTYNLSGALIEETYPSGRVVKNVLDSDGDLSIVQSKKNQTAGYWNYAKSFTYTAAGAVSSMQLGNGKWESTQFNSRLQPTQIALGTTQGGADKLNLVFNYGTTQNNGNVQSQTITVPTLGAANGFTATQNYTYDELNRLKQASESIMPLNQSAYNTWKQTFIYDRYGNRSFDEAGTSGSYQTTTLSRGCSTSSYNPNGICDKKKVNPTFAASNRIAQDQDGDTVNDYLFDAAGNTTGDAQSRKFTYDAENKQTKVEILDTNGNVISSPGQYFYDGDGKRVKKYNPQTQETTIFVYDASGKMVAEYSTTVEPTSTALVSYLTSDHLGSPRINTDANGNVMARHDYMPFGEEIDTATTSQRNINYNYGGDTVRQKFTAYERDNESDLDFAQARMYSYSHGRFTSVDPLKESAKAENPQTWNRYSYSYNNPYKFTDPTGKIPGDYYDREGEYIGTDGIQDNKIYLLNERRQGTEFPCKVGESNEERIKQVKDASTEVGGLMVMTRTEETKNSTTSEFKTIGGVIEKDVSGVMLEPGGPSTATPNQDKRIPEGVYNVDNYSSKKFPDNFILSNNEVSKDRKVLIHAGNNGSDTEACILPGAAAANGSIKPGTSRPKLDEIRTFIKSEGASNVKVIIRNRIPR